ncbi:toxin-antitoxin system HicB family antitoxin [Actinokineospora cianjurensis]|uniref:HicB-like protein involved in pilus formation n=1 Tax=Actinokineospora cianjurensis TaxID=585224 RepID=A0A421B972_9PSEU|nr:toxin-antitoxin system HicB family antitoxin [Actinokineospora cianjurensis]RLK60753.1 hypothetical protein CLV68_1266 [Actinokineospora cianjurensis]
MKQLITRVDDGLHARLKARAAGTNRSVNDLVVEALVAVLDGGENRRAVRERARAAGLLVVPEVTGPVDTRDEVIAATRDSGDAISSALDEERSAR